jgi:uncharacterized damage-inducible protein DinB
MKYLDLTRTLIMERRFSYNIYNAIPKDRGDYRPREEMKTIAGQLSHIGACEEWLVQGLRHDNWGFDVFTDRPERTVEEALAFMEFSRQRLMSLVDELQDEGLDRPVGPNPFFSAQMARGNVILVALPHECHHRGQLVVYLRLLGITPPLLYQVVPDEPGH